MALGPSPPCLSCSHPALLPAWGSEDTQPRLSAPFTPFSPGYGWAGWRLSCAALGFLPAPLVNCSSTLGFTEVGFLEGPPLPLNLEMKAEGA